MLKIGFFVFVTLALLSYSDILKKTSKLEQFGGIYSRWAAEHLEYEFNLRPEMEVVHSWYRLWQIKQESGKVDSVLKVTSDVPIFYEAYSFMDDCGRKATYFPEVNRTVLFCIDRNLDSVLEANSFVISALLGNLKLANKFLIFEELSETNQGFVFEMIVDIKKMKAAGLVPGREEANKIRLIFSLKKSGEPVRMSRQFDDGELEVLYFDSASFSPDEVRKSFPKIENRSSLNIVEDFTYKDALEEIRRVRQHAKILEVK